MHSYASERGKGLFVNFCAQLLSGRMGDESNMHAVADHHGCHHNIKVPKNICRIMSLIDGNISQKNSPPCF